ncbi:MAG: superinfection immunity protein [Nocardioidaceae bacterium]
MSHPTFDADSHPEPTGPLPVPVTPAGWYPLSGELRYWDGHQWTEHGQPAPAQQRPVPYGYGPAHQPQRYTAVLTDARTNAVEVTLAWIVTVLTLGYMLPWAVAASRGKSNSWAVGLVNFLLGWTLIGWVAALIMACMAHQVAAVRNY